MPNKTIIALISVTIILVALIITGRQLSLIYFGLVIIASLGGLSIWRNNHPPRKE